MSGSASMRSQQAASDPASSVWVSANAGTGKTKVLTDRVLRLLLAGTVPSCILCITYTKAAAAEMENRIHHTLSQWVAMDDAALASALRQLNDHVPDATMIRRARSLFATVLDAPEGVRIQTIHSFCQSLLRRFPLEAGVQPHFEVIDERTALELMAEARMRLFARSLRAQEGDEALAGAVDLLASRLAESQFQDLLTQLVGERRNLLPALTRKDGLQRLIADAYATLNVSPADSEGQFFAQCFNYSQSEESALRACISHMISGSKNDAKYANLMQPWWRSQGADRMACWSEYRKVWLTDKSTPRANLVTQAVTKKMPDAEEVMRAEQERCGYYQARIQALSTAQFTEAALIVVDAMLSLYSRLKKINQALDYDDLILLSLGLLKREGIAPWVLYKLDGGLDHVLIDEAQDTSPEQWELVDRLVDEFFSGEGVEAERLLKRTLFVVGDEKQSIYSFQGAAPKAFGAKSHDFSRRAEAAQVVFRSLKLSMSFRSTAAVLQVVDAVISQPHVRSGMSFQEGIVPHEAYRAGQAGVVEIWPAITGDDRGQRDIWEVQKELVNERDAPFILADRIASTIAGWLRDGEPLASQGRSIRAGDILVLVRRRNAFMHHLVRALKRQGVPVAGVDRMVLTEHIAVMDLLALAEFLLLPEDDLSLACLLKSPLCGISEQQLYELAYGRGKTSLWARLQSSGLESAEFLRGLLEQVDYIRPYELFATVLEAQGKREAFARRMGDEVFDPLDEFLALALEYERSHAPSLQGFLHWVRSGETTIKRDMEQGADAVRIMTVHGSKGLQAPIVFLPDTTDTPRSTNQPLWTQHQGERVMLWSPSGAEDDPRTAELREELGQAQEDEYRRLLYVAMTRAEDRLYVGGWIARNRKDVPEDCWYRWIVEGTRDLMRPHTHRFGDDEVEVLRYITEQSAAVATAKTRQAQEPVAVMPSYLRQPPAPEPYPPQPLVPSRSDGEVVLASAQGGGAVLSPVSEDDRYLRGNLVHRLLQWLPDTTPSQRQSAAEAYLVRYAPQWSEAERIAVLDEVLAVLAHPDMAPVFAEGSLAEVPVSGLVTLSGQQTPRLLSGQVDRLCVTDDGVWIIDYKTQRTPPARVEDVPPAYLRQMAVYRGALAHIYPNRPLHCALLWTAGPLLMPLPADLLASSLDSGGN